MQNILITIIPHSNFCFCGCDIHKMLLKISLIYCSHFISKTDISSWSDSFFPEELVSALKFYSFYLFIKKKFFPTQIKNLQKVQLRGFFIHIHKTF
uniref:Uncharacterized protein n=1 Tax=Anguilla anguilla TaxID=7936 RepID=A0A0E9WZS1_ANGAN